EVSRFEVARRKPEIIACIQAMAERKKPGRKRGRRPDTAMVEFLAQRIKSGVYPNMVSVPRDRKTQGEYAELIFMVKAMKEGLTPAKPWGDSKRYDFIVDNDRRLFRVQVRSASVLRSGTSRVHAKTGESKRRFKPQT